MGLIRNSKAGFSLIELLVTLGVLALAIGVTGGILISVIKSYQKSKLLTKIKSNGNYSLTVIEDNVRGARKVSCGVDETDPPCTNDNVIVFKDKNFVEKELGFIAGSGCTNGYIYLMDNVTPGAAETPSDKDKVTNDNSDGVNITSMDFDVATVNGVTTVSVSLEVENPSCNSVIQRSDIFKTTVIARPKSG